MNAEVIDKRPEEDNILELSYYAWIRTLIGKQAWYNDKKLTNIQKIWNS